MSQSYVFDPARNKNLIVLCDGTWNAPGQTEDGRDAPTNVWKMYKAIDQSLPSAAELAESVPQIAWYDAGVGAMLGRMGRFLSFLGGILAERGGSRGFLKKLGVFVEGATGMGVSQNIEEAYSWLCRVYEPGDRIYLFGFSRGAFQVRSLSGVLARCGLLRREHATSARDIFDLYRQVCARGDSDDDPPDAYVARIHDPERFRIHFLGVWDTVAGLGLPIWGWSFALSRLSSQYHDTRLVRIVDHAYHAVAMDEQRASFMPVLLGASGQTQDFEERWFRGAHADVGGGYADAGLSDVTLAWMMDRAEKTGLRLARGAREALVPDPNAALHDEIARNAAYTLTGLWPRMFPPDLPNRESALDGSIALRAQRFAAETSQRWAGRLAERQRRDTLRRAEFAVPPAVAPAMNEGWDYPEADPRELGWTVLGQGQSAAVDVLAERPWNPTGVVLLKDHTYRLVANGEWFDLRSSSDANGITSRTASIFSARAWLWWAKRMRRAPWMQLVGMINHSGDWKRRTLPGWQFPIYLLFKDPAGLTKRQFAIGTGRTFTAARTGPLYCFANDLWRFHGNNSGRIRLTITCVPDAAPGCPPADELPRVVGGIGAVLAGLALAALVYAALELWAL